MNQHNIYSDYPYLLNRQQAANFLGVDPKSFDKFFRSHPKFERFMVGKHERYTIKSLVNFVENNKC